MSTEIDVSQFTYSGSVDENTIARTTKRLLPPDEDPRTRRFGNNPGLAVMECHPRDSGRQISLIPAGILVKFETTPMKFPTIDVDAKSKAPLETMGELLALDAVNNVARNYAGEPDMGFRELTPLTALTDQESRRLFGFAHPPFQAITSHRSKREPLSILDEIAHDFQDCPYELNVCVTCRYDLLKRLDGRALAGLIAGLPEREALDHGRLLSLRDVLFDGAAALKRYWTVEFGAWTGEVDDRSKNTGYGIRNLTPGHLYVMEQLHELSPADRQNQATQSFADVQGETMRVAVEQMGSQIANAMRQGRDEAVEQARIEMEAVKAQMADMQAAMARMLAAQQTAAITAPENPAPPVAPAETGGKKEKAR